MKNLLFLLIFILAGVVNTLSAQTKSDQKMIKKHLDECIGQSSEWVTQRFGKPDSIVKTDPHNFSYFYIQKSWEKSQHFVQSGDWRDTMQQVAYVNSQTNPPAQQHILKVEFQFNGFSIVKTYTIDYK